MHLARIRRQVQLSLLAILAATFIGCGGSNKEDDDGNVTIEQPGSKTDIARGKGGVALPDDFDKDIPVYPKSKVVLVNTNPAMLVVALETGDSLTQAYDFYKTELADNDWETAQSVRTEKGGSISARKESRVCTVTIATKNKTGETVINLMIQTLPK